MLMRNDLLFITCQSLLLSLFHATHIANEDAMLPMLPGGLDFMSPFGYKEPKVNQKQGWLLFYLKGRKSKRRVRDLWAKEKRRASCHAKKGRATEGPSVSKKWVFFFCVHKKGNIRELSKKRGCLGFGQRGPERRKFHFFGVLKREKKKFGVFVCKVIVESVRWVLRAWFHLGKEKFGVPRASMILILLYVYPIFAHLMIFVNKRCVSWWILMLEN